MIPLIIIVYLLLGSVSMSMINLYAGKHSTGLIVLFMFIFPVHFLIVFIILTWYINRGGD